MRVFRKIYEFYKHRGKHDGEEFLKTQNENIFKI